VLAIDTATPAITAGVVRFDPTTQETLAARATVDPRAHGELLTPHLADALTEAGLDFEDVDAIVCGTGPGPFTGLRVGMVTAASLAHALAVPLYGVHTHDAIAADATTREPLLVVTDARRREVYWTAYHPTGTTGPDVLTPAHLAERLPDLGVTVAAGHGARLYADVLGLPVIEPAYPSPAGLVKAAAKDIETATPSHFRPLYLRRPDAVEPAARKKVTA
jgi:tRNA threonylcarbamoyl adenosine modification protein YeaZ